MVLCVGYVLNITEHHTSILWYAMLMALWLAWGPASTTAISRVDRMFRFVLVAVLIEQAAWTAHAAYYDIRGPFDGGLAAYQFLESQPRKGDTGLAGSHAVSMQPYSATNLFFNQSTRYIPWQEGRDAEDHLDQLVSQRPAFIVDSESGAGNVIWSYQFKLKRFVPNWDTIGNGTYLEAHGYHLTHKFCGLQPSHFGFSNLICIDFYEPTHAVAVSDASRK